MEFNQVSHINIEKGVIFVFAFCTIAPSRGVHLSILLVHVNSRKIQSLLAHLTILFHHFIFSCTKMSRRSLIMSTRNEKAKRLNANEDNLLRMEMERFQKQHNKEMKSIILEGQTAKEAISDVRRQRASSVLTTRKLLHETKAPDDRSDNSPALFEKVFCQAKKSQVSSKMVPGLETNEDRSSCWKTYQLNPTQKESDLDREFSIVTSLLPKNDHFGSSRKQTQSSKIVQSSETLRNTLILQKPCTSNPSQKTSNRALKSTEYLNATYLASAIDHFEQSPRIHHRSSTEGTTDARSALEGTSSRSGSRLSHMAKQYREQQGTSAVKNIPAVVIENVADDNRARSHSDDSMLFKRVQTPNSGLEKRNLSPKRPSSARSRGNSPEPGSFHSSLIRRVSLPRTSPMNQRARSETGSKLLAKRSSLEPSHNSWTQSQSQKKLSPSRGIAKFRQIGSAAAAAQTLVSRYHREKAILNATENLDAERQRKDKVRQEHQQMKEDWEKDGCTRTTGLEENFLNIA